MTAAPRAYRFRAARIADLPMLRGWLATPDVALWWDPSDPYDAAELADPRLAQWIVDHAGHPFAYIQDYDVSAWPAPHWSGLPRGTRGIDQFIGRPDMLGRGHGTAFLRQAMRRLFADGAPAIVTDPHPDNARAIAAYARLGFRIAGPETQTAAGPIIPMIADRPPS